MYCRVLETGEHGAKFERDAESLNQNQTNQVEDELRDLWRSWHPVHGVVQCHAPAQEAQVVEA